MLQLMIMYAVNSDGSRNFDGNQVPTGERCDRDTRSPAGVRKLYIVTHLVPLKTAMFLSKTTTNNNAIINRVRLYSASVLYVCIPACVCLRVYRKRCCFIRFNPVVSFGRHAIKYIHDRPAGRSEFHWLLRLQVTDRNGPCRQRLAGQTTPSFSSTASC